MSPAPGLERYIGSCLISAPDRGSYKKEHHPPPYYPHHLPEFHYQRSRAGWTGLPLISMGPPRRGKKQETKQQEREETRSPLSRLAVHTQGAPLVQAGGRQAGKGRPYKPRPKTEPKEGKTKERGGDTASVASDESSANSENTLPRIIKPRKRRKKDRKPQGTQQPEQRTENTSIVTLEPYTPLCYETFDPEKEKPGVKVTVERRPKEDGRCGECECSLCCEPIEDRRESGGRRLYEREQNTLHVSSEIVTSPNGHRDIEIKFFSVSPVSPPQPRSPAPVSPPWAPRIEPQD